MFAWFFFFQAEDGIRDRNVTGVQTCALPISPSICLLEPYSFFWFRTKMAGFPEAIAAAAASGTAPSSGPAMRCTSEVTRSEERRVGKECKCGGVADEEKKKVNEKCEIGGSRW